MIEQEDGMDILFNKTDAFVQSDSHIKVLFKDDAEENFLEIKISLEEISIQELELCSEEEPCFLDFLPETAHSGVWSDSDNEKGDIEGIVTVIYFRDSFGNTGEPKTLDFHADGLQLFLMDSD